MPERRTRPAGWLRSACRAAAVLVMAGLLTAPGDGARGGSLFDVSVTPAAAAPGDDVTVSFTALDENLAILSCAAELEGQALPECTGSGGAWSVHFTVPQDAKPATTTITWQLRYYSAPDSELGAGPAKGVVDFTVLPSEAQPDVSVALDRASGRAGEAVTASFTPLDPKTTITTCSLLIAGITFSDCATSGTVWSLPFTVPASADVGSTSVEWTVVYERGRQKDDASGTIPFTVLPPDTPTPSFTVSVNPESSLANGTVTLLFSTDDVVRITGCSGQLEGVPLPACAESGREWSIPFTVPKDAAVGLHTITWQLTYARETLLLDTTTGATTGEAKGAASVTVLAPIVTSTPPPTSTRTTSAGPAQGPTPDRPTSTRTSGAAPAGTNPNGGQPVAADPTDTALTAWVREHSNLGLLLVLITLAALAGTLLRSQRRPLRRSGPDRSDGLPLSGQVRAVAHPGAPPALLVRDTGDGRRSRTVRLAAHLPPPSSDLKEVT